MSTQVTFTEAEQKVIDVIKGLKNDGIELIYACDMDYHGCGDMKQIRGTLASLAKKDVIYVDKAESGLISLLID